MGKNFNFTSSLRGFLILVGVSTYATTSFAVDLDKSWFLKKISAPAFWEHSTGSKSVKVLLCDTGIEATHPDLNGNIGVGKNFVDGSSNTGPTNPHGTRLAGVIGALGNDGGAAGVNLNVTIIPGKISNDAKGAATREDAAKCIRWGADQGIKVVNLSYSSFLNEPVIHDAAKYLHDKGGILVMAAGNVWVHKDTPDDPYIIAVGMVNQIDWKTQFDSFGPFIDIVAPGTAIYTTEVGGKYIQDTGTSIAAAVVSGAAALILSVKPDLNADQLTDVLFRSTIDLGTPGRDDSFGVGRLDLSKTLEILHTL